MMAAGSISGVTGTQKDFKVRNINEIHERYGPEVLMVKVATRQGPLSLSMRDQPPPPSPAKSVQAAQPPRVEAVDPALAPTVARQQRETNATLQPSKKGGISSPRSTEIRPMFASTSAIM